MAFNRISAIAIKELLHMVRDRLTFVSLLSVTIGYVIVFGYAINPDPRHIPTIVVDHDKSEFSRLYKAALQQSVYLEIDPRQLTSDQASEMLRKAQTSVVIEIPPDFSRKLMRGLPAQILVEADATDPVSLNGAITSTGEVARQTAAHLFRRDETEITGQPQLEVRVQRRFNPQGEQTFFIIPGLVGMILNVSLLVMTAMSITKEKEQGSMEFLLVTPTEPWEMIIGKIIPTFLVGVIQVSIILMIAFFLFKLPLTGDPLGHPDLHAGHVADAGDAAVVLLLPAVHPAVGLHVPVQRHAGLGAGDLAGPAPDLLRAGLTRRLPQGVHAHRHVAAPVADHARRPDLQPAGHQELPTHAELTPDPPCPRIDEHQGERQSRKA